MSKLYGYVRVSSRDQNEDRQLIALNSYNVHRKNIYIDKLSGKDFNRPSYLMLLKQLKPVDTLVIKSIDRLGRNYEEIIEQWRVITKEIRSAIVVIDMPLLDTRQKGKDLTGIFISDLVLQILSYVAQTEREFNHRRQEEEIAAAKASGVVFGRPRKEPPQKFEELALSWENGEISAKTAAKELGVCHKTFLSWARSRDK